MLALLCLSCLSTASRANSLSRICYSLFILITSSSVVLIPPSSSHLLQFQHYSPLPVSSPFLPFSFYCYLSPVLWFHCPFPPLLTIKLLTASFGKKYPINFLFILTFLLNFITWIIVIYSKKWHSIFYAIEILSICFVSYHFYLIYVSHYFYSRLDI